MDLTEESVKEFTDALASASPTPGGGGACALAAGLGIALGDMVGAFTTGKKAYADVEEEIQTLMHRAGKLREELLACVEKDAVAFEPLSKAYGIPKDDPDRDAILEECLKNAAEVPMEILSLSCEAMELIRRFGEIGSRIMRSDAATGAALCRAAIAGAAMNVKVNTKLMKDRAFADRLDAQVNEKLQTYTRIADEVFTSIYES